MQYFGGKSRISETVSEYINYTHTHLTYVEPFCGACNVACKVNIENKILNDKHPYLVTMWKALQNGWLPPKDVSSEKYNELSKNKDIYSDELVGFVGFACSFGGKWFGGYARDKKDCGDSGSNYALRGYNSLMKKLDGVRNAKFINCDFLDLHELLPSNSLIYCDPPYKNTTSYNKKLLGGFPYEIFIEWVKIMSEYNTVLVSEYKHNVPNGARIVLEIPQRKSMRDKNGNNIETVEVLFTYNNI